MNATFIYRQKGKDSMYKVWHEIGNRVMFLYVTNASGSIVAHEKIYPLKTGALFFIGARKSHYTMPENPDTYIRDKLFLSIPHFEAICSLCDVNDHFKKFFAIDKLVYAQIPAHEQPKIEQLLSDLQHHQNEEYIDEAVLVSVCARLLAYITKYTANNLAAPISSNFIFQAIKYINQHIAEVLTVEEISSAVFMSKYYFCRKFKTVTGLSVMKYILITRLSLAQELLLEKKLTISQISDQCGFSSLAYFCNVFKQHNGKTPLQYRKQATDKKTAKNTMHPKS